MLSFSGLTEIGPVREENQDAILLPFGPCPPGMGPLFALSDGMGGYAQGGLASNLALGALLQTFYHTNGNGSTAQSNQRRDLRRTLQRGIEAANLAVIHEAHRQNIPRMGTTLTAVAPDITPGSRRLYLAHVGDSRAYLIRAGSATCLTQDHTVVGDLVRMRILHAGQVRGHARRSILTKAVGLDMFIQPDVFTINLQPGDRLVLCSDGLWSVMEDEEIAGISAGCQGSQSMKALCRALIDLALERGTDDNVSVIGVDVQDITEGKPDEASNNGQAAKGWLGKLWGRKGGML